MYTSTPSTLVAITTATISSATSSYGTFATTTATTTALTPNQNTSSYLNIPPIIPRIASTPTSVITPKIGVTPTIAPYPTGTLSSSGTPIRSLNSHAPIPSGYRVLPFIGRVSNNMTDEQAYSHALQEIIDTNPGVQVFAQGKDIKGGASLKTNKKVDIGAILEQDISEFDRIVNEAKAKHPALRKLKDSGKNGVLRG